jgi:hypothetical protein
VIRSEGITGWEDKFAELQGWLGLWTAKNEDNINQIYMDTSMTKDEKTKAENRLEQDLLSRFKMILLGTTDACYWHVFYSQTIEAVLPPGKSDKTCEDRSFMIEINIPQFKKFRFTKKLFAFTRKGLEDPMWVLIPSAWKEIVIFVAMFSIFLTFMSCPKDDSRLDDSDFLHRHVCSDRKSITSYAAMAVIAMVMWTWYKRRVAKSEKDAARRYQEANQKKLDEVPEKKLK